MSMLFPKEWTPHPELEGIFIKHDPYALDRLRKEKREALLKEKGSAYSTFPICGRYSEMIYWLELYKDELEKIPAREE